MWSVFSLPCIPRQFLHTCKSTHTTHVWLLYRCNLCQFFFSTRSLRKISRLPESLLFSYSHPFSCRYCKQSRRCAIWFGLVLNVCSRGFPVPIISLWHAIFIFFYPIRLVSLKQNIRLDPDGCTRKLQFIRLNKSYIPIYHLDRIDLGTQISRQYANKIDW